MPNELAHFDEHICVQCDLAGTRIGLPIPTGSPLETVFATGEACDGLGS